MAQWMTWVKPRKVDYNVKILYANKDIVNLFNQQLKVTFSLRLVVAFAIGCKVTKVASL